MRLAEASRIPPKWIVTKGVVQILIAALASAQYDLPPCKLNERFPEVRGTWVEVKDTDSIAGYNEATCPDFVHVTDCLRQSKDREQTLAEYRSRFEPDGCHLPAFDAHQASECLSNRRLILIGDSMTWSQFESLACILGPLANSSGNSALFNAQHYHEFTGSKYRGDLTLPTNASVHMRGMNQYSSSWQAWVSELGGIRQDDVLVVNFGAHYTQGTVEEYQSAMREVILGQLRELPCTVFWREYSPSHFGDTSGKYFQSITKDACAPATVGETEYNAYTREILSQCGTACAHIRWLPVFGPSLARHGSHTGDHIPNHHYGDWLEASHRDCRHFCQNVVNLWNQILFGMMCQPASALT